MKLKREICDTYVMIPIVVSVLVWDGYKVFSHIKYLVSESVPYRYQAMIHTIHTNFWLLIIPIPIPIILYQYRYQYYYTDNDTDYLVAVEHNPWHILYFYNEARIMLADIFYKQIYMHLFSHLLESCL